MKKDQLPKVFLGNWFLLLKQSKQPPLFFVKNLKLSIQWSFRKHLPKKSQKFWKPTLKKLDHREAKIIFTKWSSIKPSLINLSHLSQSWKLLGSNMLLEHLAIGLSLTSSSNRSDTCSEDWKLWHTTGFLCKDFRIWVFCTMQKISFLRFFNWRDRTPKHAKDCNFCSMGSKTPQDSS